jgi:hypothetical protein
LASPATGRFRSIALGLPERLRQPRDFVDGDPSRLVLCQHLRPPRFGFAPSEWTYATPSVLWNISEWMEHVIARAD